MAIALQRMALQRVVLTVDPRGSSSGYNVARGSNIPRDSNPDSGSTNSNAEPGFDVDKFTSKLRTLCWDVSASKYAIRELEIRGSLVVPFGVDEEEDEDNDEDDGDDEDEDEGEGDEDEDGQDEEDEVVNESGEASKEDEVGEAAKEEEDKKEKNEDEKAKEERKKEKEEKKKARAKERKETEEIRKKCELALKRYLGGAITSLPRLTKVKWTLSKTDLLEPMQQIISALLSKSTQLTSLSLDISRIRLATSFLHDETPYASSDTNDPNMLTHLLSHNWHFPNLQSLAVKLPERGTDSSSTIFRLRGSNYDWFRARAEGQPYLVPWVKGLVSACVSATNYLICRSSNQ
ncbi:hypothetical protein CC2G_004206 [Coprinopsis cinerea AmutBmut pab1-1]|nr:hypothetical protein CC2G_004206 [Coprinopsis cinerea AmutBmut pab1-1]